SSVSCRAWRSLGPEDVRERSSPWSRSRRRCVRPSRLKTTVTSPSRSHTQRARLLPPGGVCFQGAMMYSTRTAPLVLALSALIVGCQKSDQTNAAGTTARDSQSGASGEVSTPATPVAAAKPSDAEIFAILTEANEAEIDAAKAAVSKSKHADVKAFARSMIADHTKLLKGGQALSDSLHVTPQAPGNDSLATHVQQGEQARGTAAGATLDKTYMDAQVQDHQTVLDLLKQFEGQATEPRLKALIQNAEPIVQRHLTRAQAIDAKLTANQA